MTASDRGLRTLTFHGPGSASASARAGGPAPSHLAGALDLLERYLAGDPVAFDVPLDLEGTTEFQRRVWQRLREIPRGRVVSYGELARELGSGPGAARAVGGAVGSNPLPVVIPCHRVVRADGGLGGFGGGLPRKAALLRLEGVHVEGVGRGEAEADAVRPSSRVSEVVLRLPL